MKRPLLEPNDMKLEFTAKKTVHPVRRAEDLPFMSFQSSMPGGAQGPSVDWALAEARAAVTAGA